MENKNKPGIIEQEIQTWQNSRTLIEIRYRVNKRLGAMDAIKACEDELVKIETALDELEKIKQELTSPSPA